MMKRKDVQHLKLNTIHNAYVGEFGEVYNEQKDLLVDFRLATPLKSPIPLWPYVIHKLLLKCRNIRAFKLFKWEMKVAPLDYTVQGYMWNILLKMFSLFKDSSFYQRLEQRLKVKYYGQVVFKARSVVNMNDDTNDDYVIAMNYFMASFGHLMINVLPAVYIAWKQLPKTTKFLIPRPHDPKTVYFDPYRQYIHLILDALGVEEDRRIYLKNNELVKFNKLHFVSTLEDTDIGKNPLNIRSPKMTLNDIKTYVDHGKIYQYLSDYYCDPILQEKYKNYQYIYMSVNKLGHKVNLSEPELKKQLEMLGFRYFDMQDLSFIESINLFRNVHICVTTDGSNMYNLLWSFYKIQLLFFNHDTAWFQPNKDTVKRSFARTNMTESYLHHNIYGWKNKSLPFQYMDYNINNYHDKSGACFRINVPKVIQYAKEMLAREKDNS